MENVMIALITGGLSLLGVILTNIQGNKKMEQQIVTAQAVTDVKIESLREEVKKHNDFGSRIPIIEEKVHHIEDRMNILENDIKDLKNV